MDFGKLLRKEIDKKRTQPPAKKARVSPAPRIPENSHVGPLVSASTAETDNVAQASGKDIRSANGMTNVAALDSKTPKPSSLAPEPSSQPPEPSSQTPEPSTKTRETLLKRARYARYLEAENNVAATFNLSDIAAVGSPEAARRLSMQVRKFVKQIIRNWESDPRPPFPALVLDETKRDVVRLMYKLRSEKLVQDMLVSLCTIIYYIQEEAFSKANEAYLKLSIGNVAWPIGVRDVGIHARAADAKITGDDKSSVANIMQNEKTRRWIIAVKRLLNYCEHAHRGQAG